MLRRDVFDLWTCTGVRQKVTWHDRQSFGNVPVHGVDFGQVTFQSSLGSEGELRKRFSPTPRNFTYCVGEVSRVMDENNEQCSKH